MVWGHSKSRYCFINVKVAETKDLALILVKEQSIDTLVKQLAKFDAMQNFYVVKTQRFVVREPIFILC